MNTLALVGQRTQSQSCGIGGFYLKNLSYVTRSHIRTDDRSVHSTFLF